MDCSAERAAWPGAGLAQQPESNGYAIGGGTRLYFVRAGEGPLMLFVYGHPDGVALYELYVREFGRDHWQLLRTYEGIRRRTHPRRSKPMRCRASLETFMVSSIILAEINASWLTIPRCFRRGRAIAGTRKHDPNVYRPSAIASSWRRLRKSLICIRPVGRLADRGHDGSTRAPSVSLADRSARDH